MARGDGIKKVSELFAVYQKRLRAPQGSVIEAFIEVTEDVLGIRLKKESVSYTLSTRVLSLRTSGTLKTEILLRKAEILAHLKGRLGIGSAPRDII